MTRWGTWAAAVLGAGGLTLLGQQALSGAADATLVGGALWMIAQAWAYLAPARTGADGEEPPAESGSTGPPQSSPPASPS